MFPSTPATPNTPRKVISLKPESLTLWKSARLWFVLIAISAGFSVSLRAQNSLLITEFMANNETTLRDDLGVYSDWIEIYNSGTNTVNVGGYYLTDDPAQLTQWQFPATNLAAGRYLVVFASGANRTTPGKPLHTNFKLGADGDYLALVKPDGVTVVNQFGPSFPPQQSRMSFGLAVEDVPGGVSVGVGAPARFLVPTNDLGLTWTQRGFDDTGWSNVITALKYDRGSSITSYDNLAGTDLEASMYGLGSTAYIRIPFAGIDPARVRDFQLFMRYDDGFVAYLNGQEVVRRLAPVSPQWNSVATVSRSNDLALVTESINLIENLSLLQPGTNVLAIHGMNRSQSDSDFLILPELVAREVKVLTNVARYFATPTPGAANIAGLPGAAGEVRFSLKSTTFVDPFPLALQPVETAAGAVVRYTLDRSIPTESSPVYTNPLTISTSAMVRAKVFAPGLFPGPVKTEGYIALNSTVTNVTSDLPILVIHSFGGGRVNGTVYTGAFLTIHEPVRGRSALTNAPDLVTRAAFKDRGSSTAGQAKANYAVELWDEENGARSLSILGMPAESDWVFHAPYNFDPALIRNPLAYEMGHQLGRYASRYRFVEVYVNGTTVGGGPISSASYVGVYNILEKIKVGKNRVDIDELRPADNQIPEVTGGYLLKIDRLDPSDTGFTAGGRSIAYVEPKEIDIKSVERDPQEKYLTAYINSFGTALNGASYTNETRGYAPFIDADSWIDQHIVDCLTWNVDALRLSSYFHKPRNGPLTYGPLWDFDRSLGSTDGRDANPRVWGDTFFTDIWWARLYRDPNFWQKWIDRWQNVRQAQFSNASFMAIIDGLAAQVQEAAPRDFNKWRQPKRGVTQQAEITFLKNWLTNRLDFFDTNLLSKPLFSQASGQLLPGFTLTMAGPNGAEIYYTVDGTDPRLSGGLLSPAALLYNGPIALAKSTTVLARSRNLNHRNLTGGNNPPISSPWSGLTRARFSSYPPLAAGKITITEIQYHPGAPSPRELSVNAAFTSDDFEFIELKNISPDTVDLFGASFKTGIEFTFTGGGLEVLPPGQRLLLVKNLAAFNARYGARTNLAGAYTGSLDNGGERLVMENADGNTILDFTYQSRWHPITDGLGFSLAVYVDNAALDQTGRSSNWRPSTAAGGSPGTADPAPPLLPPVFVNEVLAYSDKKDAIELFNPSPIAAAVGGWFLTDDLKVPKKFRIPDGTSIPAGGFLQFDEDDFDSSRGNGERFSFNRFGEQVYLFAADAGGNLLGRVHGFDFGASEKGASFGRIVTSTGEEQFVAQTAPSLKAPNAGPKIGPVVINEIMYHPPDVFVNGNYYDNAEDEFIELRNITAQSVALFDPAFPTNTWRLRSAANFDFPTNLTLPPQGQLLLVSFNPASNRPQWTAFTNKYRIPAGTVILGPYSGKLDNSSDNLKLLKPGEPEPASSSDPGLVPYILVDAVEYAGAAPWPVSADGLGHSLQRINATQYGNDAGNWSASPPTPGADNKRGTPPAITSQPQSRKIIAGADASFSVAAGGGIPLAYQWRFRGRNIPGATNATLFIARAKTSDAGDYQVVVLNSDSSAISDPALLTVLQTAVITLQPQGRNVNSGTNVTFAITAQGTGLLQFQWQWNGSNIPGATRASLVLTNVQPPDSGSYTIVVTDAIGSATSEPAVLNVLVKPQFTLQPESLAVLEGDTVTLSVSATGTLPLTYRWLHDGITIAGATNPVLRLSNVQLSDSGTYIATVTNIASARIATPSIDAILLVLSDFDNDRMADVWETANGLAPSNSSDARLDADGDGLTNLQEYLAGTDPRDPKSYLKFDAINTGTNATILQFLARSNRNYTVQFRPVASGGAWTNLISIPGRPAERMESIADPGAGKSNRFYRIITPAAP